MSLSRQPYAAMKAREYLDKPAIHETMVKVCKTHLISPTFVSCVKECMPASGYVFSCTTNI